MARVGVEGTGTFWAGLARFVRAYGLAVVEVARFEDKAAGMKYFVKALEIRPDIELTEALATKSVKAAFDEAGKGGTSGDGSAAAAVAEKGAEKPDKETKGKELEEMEG